MKPIIIFGTMGSGKDTLAEMLQEQMFGSKIYKLGKEIRETVDKACPDVVDKRPLYQDYGQVVRETLGIDAWNNIRSSEIELDKALHNYIIPIIADGRQINEYTYWKEKGFYIVGIEAPPEVRYERLVKRDGVCDRKKMFHDTELQAQYIVTQLADFQINNNYDLDILKCSCEAIIDEIKKQGE